jgi:hypothetical protein
MQQLMRLYRLVNLLSIDVAGGAVCSALFFAYLLNVRILPYGVIALGLSVWIIYTVDHLLDAKKIKAPAATARHRFHQDNFKVLCAAVLLATILNGIIILFIRHQVFVAGLFVALTVGIYFDQPLSEIYEGVFYSDSIYHWCIASVSNGHAAIMA